MMLALLLTIATATISADAIVEAVNPDYCGKGPVEIVVSRLIPCASQVCHPSVSGSREWGYTVGGCDAMTTQACYETVVQTWTDYPECGGGQM